MQTAVAIVLYAQPVEHVKRIALPLQHFLQSEPYGEEEESGSGCTRQARREEECPGSDGEDYPREAEGNCSECSKG